MAIEEEPVPGIPEWVVTFGDMMSLLLTFFIMLVSMSEIKEEEKYRAMLESMRRQFGHEASMASVLPGEMAQANSALSSIAPSQARALRKNLMKGGNQVKSVTGEHSRVQNIRQGRNSTNGGVIFFGEDSSELTAQNEMDLLLIAQQLAGKPQKIEVRGHASRKPVDPHLGFSDHWALAFQRGHVVMQFLITQGISPERIRLGSAGAFEPVDTGLDPEERKRNARVEILMWDERVTSP